MCGTGRGGALILIAILCLPVSGADAQVPVVWPRIALIQ